MNDIQRHIEILLLDHDCVIVPGFGGFVAYQTAARYEAAERTFLPPARTLGFNAQLTINDSLLAQSYIEAYDISYPEALRRIEDEVAHIRHELSTQGRYELNNLGTLVVNAEGNYEFEPCEAGILSPDFYGLDSFRFCRLGDQSEEPAQGTAGAQLIDIVSTQQTEAGHEADNAAEATAAAEEATEEPKLLEFIATDDDDNRAIRIRMSWIRNAVAVAAAAVVFFLLATPVVNSDLGNQAMTQLQGGNLLYRLMPKDSNMVPAQPVKAETKLTAEAEPKAEAAPKVEQTAAVKTAAKTEIKTDNQIKAQAASPATATTQQQARSAKATAAVKTAVKTAATSGPTYCIVVASQVRLSNAESFVEQLHRQGYGEARVYVHNNIVRVICGEYATQGEAYNRLNRLNQKEEFAEAWVYRKTEG